MLLKEYTVWVCPWLRCWAATSSSRCSPVSQSASPAPSPCSCYTNSNGAASRSTLLRTLYSTGAITITPTDYDFFKIKTSLSIVFSLVSNITKHCKGWGSGCNPLRLPTCSTMVSVSCCGTEIFRSSFLSLLYYLVTLTTRRNVVL